MTNEKRFVKVYEQGALSSVTIFADRETGVQYIYAGAGNGGGLTVLVGADGKPLLAKQPIEEWSKRRKREDSPWG